MNDAAMPFMPIAIGDTIGDKYRVEQLLGRGGMGFVVCARHSELGHLVAIKFLHPKIAERPDAVARFLREARASARLKGDHVARVTDVGTADAVGLPFMVMEYLEGSSLAALLRTARLPIGHAVALVSQACEAIEEAHGLGIVHRDIKPDNLFVTTKLDGTPSVKVLDFGISQVPPSHPDSARLTGTADIIGTPLYMSPEQMQSARDADRRSDIWSLGVTLFELLTGDLPFPGENVAQICARVLVAEPRRPRALRPAIPERVELIVLRCLEKQPKNRFQRATDLKEALAEFVHRPADDDAETTPLTRVPQGRFDLAMASTEIDRREEVVEPPLQRQPAKKPQSMALVVVGTVVFAVVGFLIVFLVQFAMKSFRG